MGTLARRCCRVLCRPVERRLQRGLTSAPKSEEAYFDEWQRARIKPASVYEENAKRRHWFVTVDLQGRLYLEESRLKNITTCLKEERFLNTFFKSVRKNTTPFHHDYPFVAPCGPELTFVLPADQPIVFTDLSNDQLHFGASLRAPFKPSALFLSTRTGRLYHSNEMRGEATVGLVSTSLAQRLCEHMEEGEGGWMFRWNGEHYRVGELDGALEPIWGLPAA